MGCGGRAAAGPAPHYLRVPICGDNAYYVRYCPGMRSERAASRTAQRRAWPWRTGRPRPAGDEDLPGGAAVSSARGQFSHQWLLHGSRENGQPRTLTDHRPLSASVRGLGRRLAASRRRDRSLCCGPPPGSERAGRAPRDPGHRVRPCRWSTWRAWPTWTSSACPGSHPEGG